MAQWAPDNTMLLAQVFGWGQVLGVAVAILACSVPLTFQWLLQSQLACRCPELSLWRL